MNHQKISPPGYRPGYRPAFASLGACVLFAAAAPPAVAGHRDAPTIRDQNRTDITDVYAFVGYEPGKEDTVTFIMNLDARELPFGQLRPGPHAQLIQAGRGARELGHGVDGVSGDDGRHLAPVEPAEPPEQRREVLPPLVQARRGLARERLVPGSLDRVEDLAHVLQRLLEQL